MRIIHMTQGGFALVDDEDYVRLSAVKWHVVQIGNNQYARNTTLGYMHCYVLGLPEERIDHRDGNGLNNQKKNLRHATKSQNAANKRPQAGKQYKGISQRRGRNGGKLLAKWQAQIIRQGEIFHLGTFITEEEAARAYDTKAKELFGEFARLNFP